MDKILKGFSLEIYMGKLRGFNVMNNSIFVEALLFNLGNYNSGFIVCKTKELSTLDERVHTSQTGIDNVRLGFLDHNPSDFDLPKGSVGIFRSYPWPFSNNLKDYHLDICGKTFAGKGLIRNCTNHSGNFEMLGSRRSKQSNGSMLCSQDRVDQHHYYREMINLLLLPEAKRIVNFLMEEAISAGSTSGESLMLLYRQILNFKNEKQLCFNSIITQKKFCNTIHRDNNSVLGNENKKKVLNFLKVLRNEKKSPIHEYVDLVLSFNHQKLPKSTTCCWRLTKNYENLIMCQFFVAPYDKFCINLSSNILSNNRCVGATFYSSMFYHVTSVPVWYRKNGSVSLNGPHDMYNFAWGSEGGNKEKD